MGFRFNEESEREKEREREITTDVSATRCSMFISNQYDKILLYSAIMISRVTEDFLFEINASNGCDIFTTKYIFLFQTKRRFFHVQG